MWDLGPLLVTALSLLLGQALLSPRPHPHTPFNPEQTCFTPIVPPDCCGRGYSNLKCVRACVYKVD